jgi:hypothetical protein
MNLRGLVVTAVVACSVGWVSRSVYSEDAAPSPEQMKEMKAAFEKLGVPGAEHQRMKALVGEWNVLSKETGFDGKVTESTGTASMTMVLGGRFLRQEFSGTYEGKPFIGRGLMGFDNGSKKWVHSWIDSMSTGMSMGEGTETAQGKTWEFKSSFNGPDGTPIAMRTTMTLVSPNEMTLDGYMGESPTPMMQLRYKRK